MSSHLFRSIGFAAALACLTSPAVGLAAVVTGTDTGVFVNPVPSSGVTVTGVGTSHVTYGVGSDSLPNSLTYAAVGSISSTTETPFKLGTLTYFNGTTVSNTTPDQISLQISLNLTQPGAVNQNFNFALNLVSTPNTSDPDASADYVYFPSSFSSTTFMSEGVTYTLRVLGFENVVGDGFLDSNSSQLHVREQGTASADLYGVVTTDTSGVVPEPASIVSAAVACVFGLAGLSRRARNAARA
ncbi:choice-of-anchor K domain-containing protein [Paludisphaera borealis]|uniref:PEP-CTERM protein-sorting domain-containing protein n=1 Tax=Paludisphaera borealis TaxID=1387353 RepID=A0A1U7CL62_9BACT|nr:choice-of-anchor K domain-containing protein [Paludisphaera borealis]APW59675.1 hypothetical protein BSF38_01104 [Paludisphaera borealis]